MVLQSSEPMPAASALPEATASAAAAGPETPMARVAATFLLTLLGLLLIVFILLEADLLPGVPANSSLAHAVHALSFLNLVPVFGAFGGLLGGMHFKSLDRPHREGTDHRINLGWIADAAFGVAGGFVVFLVVPGDFQIDKGGWDTFKAFAVAMVGGFAGRALIEAQSKAIMQKILEKKIDDNQAAMTAKVEESQAAVSAKLERTTETVTRMFSSQALRLDEYVAEVRRILEKDDVKHLSVVYADVDGLRRHLKGRSDERALRALVLEELELALEHAVAEHGYKWDMFSVFPAISDRILVVRGATLEDTARVAERARTLFKESTRGRKDLGLEAGETLTMSAGVACSSGQKLESMSADAEKRLKMAKDSGHDRVIAEERPPAPAGGN